MNLEDVFICVCVLCAVWDSEVPGNSYEVIGIEDQYWP